MIELLLSYGLFLAKTVTIALAIVFVFVNIVSIAMKARSEKRDQIQVKNLNEKYLKYAKSLIRETTSKQQYKQIRKAEKQRLKSSRKQKISQLKKRMFVVSFLGDTQASELECLEEEINAILTVATPQDEVMVRLESTGGMVHSYGLAASQLSRVKDKGILLTVSVDKVAASGGYMMACVADKIIAAPFAIIGSIGVIAQLPNFNKLLKRHHIDYEQITAGKYKRTLTLLGENSEEDREKVRQDLDETHQLFKEFILENRAALDIESVATGDVWYGSKAKDKKLIDEVMTSDDYLMAASQQADIFEITYEMKKPLSRKLPLAAKNMIKQMTESY